MSLSYFVHFFEQNREFSLFSVLVVIFLAFFLASWLTKPWQMINAVLFTIFFLMFGAWLTFIVYSTNLSTLKYLYFGLFMLILLVIILVTTFAWLFCLWNAYFVWKHESHTLPNLLTLILGLGLILLWIITLLGPAKYLPKWLNALLTVAPIMGGYLGLIMYNFLVNLLLYQFVPRRYQQNYLIVLGAGLIDGEVVTPLLASRINRAIQFAQKQAAKGRPFPKLIMSGGQGPNEKISEAQAMTNYAISRGIDPKNILLEDRSTNTYQNMLYSKEIAAKDFGSEDFKAKFFSNNYHIYRAAIFAHQVGLKADGVGSYTRPYFLPNAVIREFAGVFIMHKRAHFIILGLIGIIGVIRAVLTFFN